MSLKGSFGKPWTRLLHCNVFSALKCVWPRLKYQREKGESRLVKDIRGLYFMGYKPSSHLQQVLIRSPFAAFCLIIACLE